MKRHTIATLTVLCGLLATVPTAYAATSHHSKHQTTGSDVHNGLGNNTGYIIMPWSTKHFHNIPTFTPSVVKYSGSYSTLIDRASMKYGVPSMLIAAVIQQESGYSQNAVSNKGAVGLMQLMPSTAATLHVNPYNTVQNVNGGTEYLSRLIQQFGSYSLALAAYNAGPQAVERYDGIPPYSETETYVSNILEMYNESTVTPQA